MGNSLSYFQFIVTLEMLKSDPAQNAIADNLDDDDDDMKMAILMKMTMFAMKMTMIDMKMAILMQMTMLAMKMVQPWREVQRGRR